MVAPCVNKARRTTQHLLQERLEELNTTNMTTATWTENYSQRLPNHWSNAEKSGTSGYQKSSSNT